MPDPHSASADRPHVFISYAREDQDFVDRVLRDRLENHGKRLWVDRTDIPAASEWEARIRLGVEGANALIFVLSGDSVRSDACTQEVQLALALHKRVIPVVRRDIDPAEVPGELRRWQWIWLRNDDEIEDGTARILEALETDLDWRDAHSRLNVRSLEWERAGHEASMLLRGRDLVAAEAWYAEHAGHSETPTQLQTSYIFASRRSATRRQRVLLASVTAGLLIAVVLSVFAVVQRSRAIEEAHVARSRELAVSADAALGSDPELSVLLAREGVREAPTAESVRILRTALDRSRVRSTLRHRDIASAAFSPDGEQVLTAGGDGSARLWDTNGRLLKSLDGGVRDLRSAQFDEDGRRAVTIGMEDDRDSTGVISVWSLREPRLLRRWKSNVAGYTAAFTPGGQYVVTTAPLGPVVVWEARNGNGVVSYESEADLVAAADLSGDGRRLAVTVERFGGDSDRRYSTYVVSMATGRRLVRLRGSDAIGRAIATSRTGDLVATSGFGDSAARVWDGRTGAPIARLRGHADAIEDLDFSDDGRLVATASADASARIYEARSGRSLAALRGHAGPLTTVAISHDGRRAVTAGADGAARVWDLRGLPLDASPASRAYAADVSRDGRRAVVAADSPAAEVWDARSGRRLARLERHSSPVSEVAFSPDANRVATVAFDDRNGAVWNAATGELLTALRGVDGGIGPWAFSPEGARIATILGAGVVVRDVRTGRRIVTIPPPVGDHFEAVAFSPDGRRVATGELRATTLWDAKSGTRIARHDSGSTGAYVVQLAFSGDGRYVIAVDDQNVIRVLDGRTLEQLATMEGHTSSVTHVVVAPDDRRLLSAGTDQTARLWDIRTGREIARMSGHGDAVTAAAFSPDDRFIVTAAGGSAAIIWRADTGERITTVQPPRGTVHTAEFGPDGRSVVLAGPGLKPGLYPCELCGGVRELLHVADRRVTRRLTRAERRRYLHEP